MPSSTAHLSLAIGPVMPGWGSWDWIGTFLVEQLKGRFRTITFERWETPNADAVVIVKHSPPEGWVEAMSPRSAVVYCPIDAYGDASEIDADAAWLRKCAKVIVHCRRLEPYFAPVTETGYLDHPLKYAVPTRKTFRPDGPLLWVGVRSNLPPLVAWVNAHPLPISLDVLTNPERPGQVPTPAELGFRADCEVESTSGPERHRAFTAAAARWTSRGTTFAAGTSRRLGTDFVASGLPVAMNAGSSSAEHLASLGLKVPSPLDATRWVEAWKETKHLGRRLSRVGPGKSRCGPKRSRRCWQTADPFRSQRIFLH